MEIACQVLHNSQMNFGMSGCYRGRTLQIFKNCILVGKKFVAKLNLNNSPIDFYLKGAAFVVMGFIL